MPHVASRAARVCKQATAHSASQDWSLTGCLLVVSGGSFIKDPSLQSGAKQKERKEGLNGIKEAERQGKAGEGK